MASVAALAGLGRAPTGLSHGAARAVLAATACLALAVGMLIYMTDRPPGHAALLPATFALGTGALFGAVGQWLPSFVHPFAFSLASAACAAPTSRPAYGACAAWWLVNLAFEAAQHQGLRPFVVRSWHAVAGHSAPTRLLSNYLERGTFDIGDVVAATLGALAAALVLRLVHRMEDRNVQR